ncbi:hypothetical protein GCM10020254_82140 [Streptomyces goshikiensis]
MLVLQYGMLYRAVEVTNLLVRHVRLDTDGVWVWTAKSKTRRSGKGRWRFIRDRPDLQITARVRAWLADLRELSEPTAGHQNPAGGESAYLPNKPLFRALTTLGNLKRRANAKVRGLFLTGRAVNEMVKARSAAADVSVINGLKVTSHSLRAGPNTDLAEADVPSPSATRPATGTRTPPSPTTATTGPTAPSTSASATRSTRSPSGVPPAHKPPVGQELRRLPGVRARVVTPRMGQLVEEGPLPVVPRNALRDEDQIQVKAHVPDPQAADVTLGGVTLHPDDADA